MGALRGYCQDLVAAFRMIATPKVKGAPKSLVERFGEHRVLDGRSESIWQACTSFFPTIGNLTLQIARTSKNP